MNNVDVHALLHDNARIKSEWQTCEELLAESQKDNENKHAVIEGLKHYVRDLERLLEAHLGPAWKSDHGVTPPSAPNTTSNIGPTTPLPKPQSSLRHSTSLTFSRTRSSRYKNRTASAADWGALSGLKEVEGEADTTPTGALKRLEAGSTRRPPIKSGKFGLNTVKETTQAEQGPEEVKTVDSPKLEAILESLRSVAAQISDREGRDKEETRGRQVLEQLLEMEQRCIARESGLQLLIQESRLHLI